MTDPLFVESLEVLKGKLRLSDIPQGKAAEKQLDEALLRVREGFYLKLGDAKVAELLAIAFDQNFTTQASSLRALANSTEVKWVFYELACMMPVLFLDGAGLKQSWNEEGAYRASDVDKLRDKLWNEIQDALEILAQGGITDETGWRVSDIGPDETPERPHDTVRPLTVLGDYE